MTTEEGTKINRLSRLKPPGVVLLSSWLKKSGSSTDLQKHYRKSNWLESIGSCAMKRVGDDVTYEGGINALQDQAGLSIHPAGRTALSMLGKAHYIELSQKTVTLFGNKDNHLPLWFKNYDWGVNIRFHRSSFLPEGLGLVEMERKTFKLKISGPTRAIMECLYLVPKFQDLVECYDLMTGLNTLRPSEVQKLLEECKSVQVKRLFLYLAELAGHEWFNYLDLNKVDLGSGKRSLVKSGVYVPKYQITVPPELAPKKDE